MANQASSRPGPVGVGESPEVHPNERPELGAGGISGERAQSAPDAKQAIADANRDLEARTKQQLELAIAVLLEQRDEALTRAAQAVKAAEDERGALTVEHDRFVAFLMEEQDDRLDALQKELAEARKLLERRRALNGTGDTERAAGASVPPQLADVRRLLEEAYTQLDAARAAAAQLEQERDHALAAADDVRVELYTQVEAARDEAITLQSQLDDASRQLEDARDHARDEAMELTVQLDDAKRELDERRSEVTRLRARLSELEQVENSRPPPPRVPEELVKVREENQALRKDLIDAKRALSRVTREYEILRSLRSRLSANRGATPEAVRAATDALAIQKNIAASRATLAGAPIPVLPVLTPSARTAQVMGPSAASDAHQERVGQAPLSAAPQPLAHPGAPTVGREPPALQPQQTLDAQRASADARIEAEAMPGLPGPSAFYPAANQNAQPPPLPSVESEFPSARPVCAPVAPDGLEGGGVSHAGTPADAPVERSIDSDSTTPPIPGPARE